jgi:hypothetical protein
MNVLVRIKALLLHHDCRTNCPAVIGVSVIGVIGFWLSGHHSFVFNL